MKIALLCSGPVPERYHPVTGGGNVDIFRNLFDHAPEFEVELTEFDIMAGNYPDNPADFDGYVVGGSSASVYDDLDWVRKLASYYRELQAAGSKLVGICFGHQMLAHALGGETIKSPKGWGIGVHSFEIYEQQEWMTPGLDGFNVLLSCQDQVVKMPENGKLLAGNEFCNVGMFRVGGNMLGIQGHPEFLPSFSEALMDARTDRIPAETIAVAKATLDQSRNTKELATWILNFLQE